MGSSIGEIDGLQAAPASVGGSLAVPVVPPGYVPRPRLMGALSAGEGLRLTLVDAPTGYGKTMLVAAWCADRVSRGLSSCAWLSLAGAENDPGVLIRSLIGALRQAGAAVGERVEMMVRLPGANPDAWVSALIDDLASLATPITLVLDDLHLLVDPACHGLLQSLIDHAPTSVSMIVCTRSEPPVRLRALREAGQLAEIRAGDLRFDDSEAEELLVGREGLGLDRAMVASLTARTEGWAAGLYLAALWLRGQREPAAEVERFAGDNRHVVDYLSEAVLERLGEDVQWFLLATSVTDRICGSLCDALTQTSAASALEQIERSNLFLVPLDQSRTWYRYHQLFGQMLSSELARRHPDLVAGLHRRASAWYLDAGLISEAVHHALAARDFDNAAALICEYWLEIGRWGQEATIYTWLTAFDRHERRRYPELGFIGAVIVGMSGGSDGEFRPWIELAERGLADDAVGDRLVAGSTSLRAGVSFLHATFAYRDIGAALTAAARTVRMESGAHGQFLVVALADLGLLRYLSGDPASARQAVSETLRDPQVLRRPHGYIIALSTAALIALDAGDSAEAERSARRALEYAATAGVEDSAVSSLAHVALGRVLASSGQRDLAALRMEQALRLLRGGVLPAWLAYALLQAATVLAAGGERVAAVGLVGEAQGLVASFQDAGILESLLDDVQLQLARSRPRRTGADTAALTQAELLVLRLLGGSLSQRAIAQELSVSLNTVKTHTSAIYRKLEVSSRADAVARATGLELL
jgi:LuxR family transcriptional regulator, maltose regulon positive regulatory protein